MPVRLGKQGRVVCQQAIRVGVVNLRENAMPIAADRKFSRPQPHSAQQIFIGGKIQDTLQEGLWSRGD
jgi:hypothetical protein